MIFGAVTLACVLAAMTLSVHGHHPTVMLPIAVACAIVFVRHGDGRQHASAPVAVREDERRSSR